MTSHPIPTGPLTTASEGEPENPRPSARDQLIIALEIHARRGGAPLTRLTQADIRAAVASVDVGTIYGRGPHLCCGPAIRLSDARTSMRLPTTAKASIRQKRPMTTAKGRGRSFRDRRPRPQVGPFRSR